MTLHSRKTDWDSIFLWAVILGCIGVILGVWLSRVFA